MDASTALSIFSAVTLEDTKVFANGSQTNFPNAISINAPDTIAPITLSRLTVVGPQGVGTNIALRISSTNNVLVQDCSLSTLTSVAGNSAIDVSGGQNITFARNRITHEGFPSGGTIIQSNTNNALYAGNFIWVRAGTSGNPIFALTVQGTGNVTFINNTVLGAWTGAGNWSVALRSDTSTGIVAVLNNYFDDLRNISLQSSPQNLLVVSNRFFRFEHLTCPSSEASCSDDPNNGISFRSGSFDNAIADCQLAGRGSGDWHLTAGSPCIGAASPDPNAPMLDIDGDPRPLQNTLDIGADEFNP